MGRMDDGSGVFRTPFFPKFFFYSHMEGEMSYLFIGLGRSVSSSSHTQHLWRSITRGLNYFLFIKTWKIFHKLGLLPLQTSRPNYIHFPRPQKLGNICELFLAFVWKTSLLLPQQLLVFLHHFLFHERLERREKFPPTKALIFHSIFHTLSMAIFLEHPTNND